METQDASSMNLEENVKSQFEQLQQDWDDLAEIDPMWAIYSDADVQYEDWSIERFLATGKRHIRHVLDIIDNAGVAINKKGTALDFGCGIGRETQALAEEFDVCYGIDISAKMIELAIILSTHGDKCKYILNSRDDLQIFADNFFDFVYSNHVLQHMPPEIMKKYLREFVRILRPEGILLFQIPIGTLEGDNRSALLKSLPMYHPTRVWNRLRGELLGHDKGTRYRRLRKFGIPKKWLYRRFGLRPHIQMNYLDESVIQALMADCGAKVIHNDRDEIKTDNLVDAVFLVQKTESGSARTPTDT